VIPADTAGLPEGSEQLVLDMSREIAQRTRESSGGGEGGTVTLLEETESGAQALGARPWVDSPIFVIMAYFEMPVTVRGYQELIESAHTTEKGELFILPQELQQEGVPIKAALVQTVRDWTLRDAEEFLASIKE